MARSRGLWTVRVWTVSLIKRQRVWKSPFLKKRFKGFSGYMLKTIRSCLLMTEHFSRRSYVLFTVLKEESSTAGRVFAHMLLWKCHTYTRVYLTLNWLELEIIWLTANFDNNKPIKLYITCFLIRWTTSQCLKTQKQFKLWLTNKRHFVADSCAYIWQHPRHLRTSITFQVNPDKH